MNESPLRAPQLITGARMLYLVWIPEDPSAVAALVPKELSPRSAAFGLYESVHR
jgi:hypothetical protein